MEKKNYLLVLGVVLFFVIVLSLFLLSGAGEQEFFEDCSSIADWTVTGGWTGTGECNDTTTIATHNMTSSSIDLSAGDIIYANLLF